MERERERVREREFEHKLFLKKIENMSSYWRVAGLNYLKYLQVCNSTVRNALKEPMRTAAETRGAVHFREQAVVQGKRGPRYVSCEEISLSNFNFSHIFIDGFEILTFSFAFFFSERSSRITIRNRSQLEHKLHDRRFYFEKMGNLYVSKFDMCTYDHNK